MRIRDNLFFRPYGEKTIQFVTKVKNIELTAFVRQRNLNSMSFTLSDVSCRHIAMQGSHRCRDVTILVFCFACSCKVDWINLKIGKQGSSEMLPS